MGDVAEHPRGKKSYIHIKRERTFNSNLDSTLICVSFRTCTFLWAIILRIFRLPRQSWDVAVYLMGEGENHHAGLR